MGQVLNIGVELAKQLKSIHVSTILLFEVNVIDIIFPIDVLAVSYLENCTGMHELSGKVNLGQNCISAHHSDNF